MAEPRLNLKGLSVLLADGDRFTQNLIAQMLRDFQVEAIRLCGSGATAKEYFQQFQIDLCLVETSLPDMAGAELIAWMRRPAMGNNRFIPIIVLSSYTQLRLVAAVRDAGANAILRKPISPKAMFDRILMLARMPRPFIDSGNYAGPDRRFKNEEPSDGQYKRADDPAHPPAKEKNKETIE
jgi:DNA-binding response OmpR family regulator